MFLTPEELQQLTGYHPRQRMRICRWLDAKGIPYTVNRLGDPVVLRTAVEAKGESSPEPNFDWIKKSA
jgi:hypothetical protein